jgi:hypothetical protein
MSVRSTLLKSLVCALAISTSLSAGVLLSEDFDQISTLSANGWVLTNNSNPLGTTNWFQGNPTVFTAKTGIASSYIAANFDNAAFGGNISNWLITPTLSLNPSVYLSFFTRTEMNPPAADRLEVRLSTNGSSSNVGNTDSSLGDFTTLLTTINPTLDVNGYPQDWQQYVVSLSGLGGPVTGRLAFRYAVPDTSVNADYIGIDALLVATPEPSTAGLLLLGCALMAGGLAYRRRSNRNILENHEC